MEQDTTEGPVRILCGCGFEAIGPDADTVLDIFSEHAHAVGRPSWHESMFSIEGFFVALAIGTTLMTLALVVASLVGAK
jgi:hypothetical protein